MSRFIPAAAVLAATSLLLVACGGSSYSGGSSSGGSSPASATPAASTTSSAAAGSVHSAADAALDASILVDAQGMTLYRLSGESAGHFICTSESCLAVWHPLKAGSSAPTGAASLGTVSRPDGSRQVTYQGGPLYTFSPDKAPGQTNGAGLKDVGTWSVVKVGAAASPPASEPAAATSESSSSGEAGSSSSGGGGYGYK